MSDAWLRNVTGVEHNHMTRHVFTTCYHLGGHLMTRLLPVGPLRQNFIEIESVKEHMLRRA